MRGDCQWRGDAQKVQVMTRANQDVGLEMLKTQWMLGAKRPFGQVLYVSVQNENEYVCMYVCMVMLFVVSCVRSIKDQSRVSNSQTDRGRSARTYHQPLKAL